MITLYGIKNCDTVKKSMQWLKAQNIPFEFHDYKTKGISEEKLREWVKQKSADNLINRKGTTWRNLDESVKEAAKEESQAITLMKEQTSLIKRPVIEVNGTIKLIGFAEKDYSQLLNN